MQDGPTKLGRSITLTAAAVDQLVRRRALALWQSRSPTDELDFERGARVHRLPDGSVVVTFEG